MVELLILMIIITILAPLILCIIQAHTDNISNIYPKDGIKMPPRAVFFSRINGVNTLTEGGYETRYLSKRDEKLWGRNRKKLLKEAMKKGKNN